MHELLWLHKKHDSLRFLLARGQVKVDRDK